MLEKINTDLMLTKDEYHARLPDLQVRLFELQRRYWETGLGAVIAFLGSDGDFDTGLPTAERASLGGFEQRHLLVRLTPWAGDDGALGNRNGTFRGRQAGEGRSTFGTSRAYTLDTQE